MYHLTLPIIDLKIGENIVDLSTLSIYYTWKNLKSTFKNNEFKTSPPTWNHKLELSGGSYSISDNQD